MHTLENCNSKIPDTVISENRFGNYETLSTMNEIVLIVYFSFLYKVGQSELNSRCSQKKIRKI